MVNAGKMDSYELHVLHQLIQQIRRKQSHNMLARFPSWFEELNMALRPARLLVASLLLCIGLFSGVSAQHSCPPSTCGNLQIRDPFRLKGDMPTCGDRRYELTCDGNRTILDFHSGKYFVDSISYSSGNQNIQITDVGLASGGCALPSKTLSVDTILHDENFGVFGFVYPASFVNCTREIQGLYLPITCMSGPNAFVYVIFTSKVRVLAPSCRFLTMTPSNGAQDTEARVFELLQRGFFLKWVSPSCQPASFVVQDCYSKNDWKLTIYIYHSGLSNFFYRIIAPLSFQKSFVTCLDQAQDCLSNTVIFLFIKGILVLIDALTFIALAKILVRIVLPILAVFAFLVYKYREMRVPADAVEKFLSDQQSLTPTRYVYTDIIVMTRNFKDKIGQGGFGSVYKGKLPSGFQVAIKILGNSKCNGDDFISEVSTIGTIHHINIVRLVGFCSEGSKRALVYEYLQKGSLDNYIFSSEPANQCPLTSDKLIDIALGVARGIDYLHRGCDMRILHFDIKPQNILLDNCFSPKVSDFGLAKLFPKDYSMVALSVARGTIGYIAPELVSRSFGIISYKSDVYSFGMLLMEMAGGRRNVEPKAENSSQIYYPSWIYDQLDEERDIHDIVREVSTIGEIERKLSIVGLWCIQTTPSQRPSMSRVIEMLQSEVGTLQLPPKPFLPAERVISMSTTDPSMEASSSTLTDISEQESLI